MLLLLAYIFLTAACLAVGRWRRSPGLLLAGFLMLEPIKRVLSLAIYVPIVYPLRHALRERRPLRGVMLAEYLYFPTFRPLWYFLDDSIKMETGEDCARQETKYPAWVISCGWLWLRCYWWSAIRNSCVNWNNYSAFMLGRFICEEAHEGKRSFIIWREYAGGRRLYSEFWLLGRWFQIGWLNGKSPRFEIDLFKRK